MSRRIQPIFDSILADDRCIGGTRSSWSPFKNSTSARRRFHKVKGELWVSRSN